MHVWALRAAAILALAGAGLCGFVWNARRALPYDQQGRYFDAANMIVLNEQALIAYGALALGLAVIAAVCWMASRRG